MPAASSPLFLVGTNELLAAVRDAYLRDALDPIDAQAVETYLEDNPVECAVVLARYHELSAQRARAGLPEQPPPAWLHQQLQRQVSVSGWGPLRRPVVQLGLGTLLVLATFSGVRWARHEPLVPAPLRRTINSAAQTMGQPAVYSAAELREADEPSTPPEPQPAPARPTAKVARPVPAQRPGPPEASRDSRPVAIIADLAAPVQLPAALDSGSRPGPGRALASVGGGRPAVGAEVTVTRMVRGHVFDERGRPLAGATVLVRGTSKAAVTNASGAYELEVPAGAVLLVGYAGYADEQLTASQTNGLDTTLEPQQPGRTPRRARRSL